MTATAKILIIGNEPDVLDAMARLVRRAGYEALEARSGREGLDIALRERPDLILLGMVLGDEDGIELCRRIKAEPGLHDIYVALASGKKLSPEDLAAGLDAGAAEYFQFPISFEEIQPRLRMLLRLRRTEVALRAGEERLRAILDATPFPVAVVDTDDSKIIYWSQSARALFGHTAPTTTEWYRIAYPDPEYRGEVIERWKNFLQTARASSVPVNTGEYYVSCADGSVRTCELYASFIEDNLIVTFNDVTERKSAEEALRESEEHFRVLFEKSPHPTYIADARGTLIRQNQALRDLLEVTDDELVGKYNVLEDNVLAELGLEPQVRDAFENGRPVRLEIDYDSARLKSIPLARTAHKVLSTTITPILHDGGQVRFAYVQHVDITDRKLAEEDLRESEEKYRTLAENIGIGVAMISPEMKILTLNRQMREWFPEIDVSTTPVCHRAFNNPQREATCSYCPTIKTLQDGLTHEATTETPTAGGIRHFRVISTPVFGAGGEVRSAIEMVEDVTEQKLAEKERANLEEQFRQAQKMESIGRLAGGVAHDFNNLLTVILNYASLIKESLNPEDPLHTDVDEIDRAGRRAADLTSQLLAFSRKQIIAPRVLDLNSVMRDSENMLRRVIGEDVELFFVLDEPLDKVEADPGQMNQILVNLAVNARDAMPDGGKLTVETGNVEIGDEFVKAHPHSQPGPHVMLAISDSGLGMDRETRERIFEPFYTTKDVDKGTGLGLSMVYGIVKQGNGFIEVFSEVGRGTTFKIYLPVTDLPMEEEAPAPSVETPGGRETILLVEDEAAVRKVTRRMLESRGYTVLEAAQPDDALLIARQQGQSIDLVLTDMVMPNMSGWECYLQLSEIVPGIKVLFMSGYTFGWISHKGLLDKDTQYILKPFRTERLARKVREVLDGPNSASDPPEDCDP